MTHPIIQETCFEFGITEELLKGQQRKRSLVDARQKCAKRLQETGMSYPQIGKLMNRDHTSIMHLVKVRK